MGKEQHKYIFIYFFFVKRLAKLPPLVSFHTTLAALALTAFLFFFFFLFWFCERWVTGDPLCPLHTKRVYLNSGVCLSDRASKGRAKCLSNSYLEWWWTWTYHLWNSCLYYYLRGFSYLDFSFFSLKISYISIFK